LYTNQLLATPGGYQRYNIQSARRDRIRKINEDTAATIINVPAADTWIVLAEGLRPNPQ
jgi:hypothetical protein